MTPDDFWRGADIAEAQIPRGVSGGLGDAIWTWWMFGQADDIANFLRYTDALTPADQQWLADYIEGKIRLPKGKPPFARLLPANKTVPLETAAGLVRWLILEWTKAGLKRPGMKARAIDGAAAKFCPPGMGYDEFREKLDIFIARSKHQKNRVSRALSFVVAPQCKQPAGRLAWRRVYLRAKATREALHPAEQMTKIEHELRFFDDQVRTEAAGNPRKISTPNIDLE